MSVVPSTVSSVWEMSSELLLIAEDAVATTIGGAIDRSYVAPSEPAFDCCPFLAVTVPTISEGFTASGPGGLSGGHRGVAGAVNLIGFAILAVRCGPRMDGQNLPTVAEIERAAREVQEDGWALWNAVREAIRDDRFEGLCREVFFDGGSAITEQGGCVGWTFSLRASLDGIPGTEGS